ncbi:MAG: hypothetical protein K0R17_3296 [Rariglobus sp.]|jgi:hypothetical protein|nr:hypothetical protein [Rariglobus sp.]
MKTRSSRSKLISPSRPVRTSRALATPPSVELTWSHVGTLYRMTVWPEAGLERMDGERWVAASAGEASLASGMLQVDAAAWRRYLEFVPAAERTFVEKFRFGRLGALLIVARCPQLLADLNETPALVSFLAAHASLRGTDGPRWDEVAAVHERGGLFALLEWLGLPASRQTLAILNNLVDPDVPRWLLEPLRTLLWRPSATFVLERSPELTDRQLARYWHALAA